MTSANLPVLNLDEFRGVVTSLGSCIFRHLRIDGVAFDDAIVAEMYLEYVRGADVSSQLEAVRAAETHGATVTAVLWNDRHADATVHLFSAREVAESWARGKAREFDRDGRCYNESKYPDGELYIDYSPESDYLRVFDVVVDKEIHSEDDARKLFGL